MYEIDLKVDTENSKRITINLYFHLQVHLPLTTFPAALSGAALGGATP